MLKFNGLEGSFPDDGPCPDELLMDSKGAEDLDIESTEFTYFMNLCSHVQTLVKRLFPSMTTPVGEIPMPEGYSPNDWVKFFHIDRSYRDSYNHLVVPDPFNLFEGYRTKLELMCKRLGWMSAESGELNFDKIDPVEGLTIKIGKDDHLFVVRRMTAKCDLVGEYVLTGGSAIVHPLHVNGLAD